MTKNIKPNKVKANYSFSPEIKEYVDTQSEAFGMSQSGYLTMIIQQYRMQSQALSEMSKIQGYVEKFEIMMAEAKKDEEKNKK